MHTRARAILAALACALALGAPAPAQPGEEAGERAARRADPPVESLDEVILHLEGGRRVVGLLVERTDERVVIRLSGVDQALPAGKVARVTVLPPVIDRYHELRAQIGEDDFASLLQLALWLEQRERYDLALAEVARALALEPTDRRALQIQRRLKARKELAEKIRRRAGTPEAEAPPDAEPAPDAPGMPRLTPEQINLIRVFEVDLADPPRLAIDREVVERLIARYDGAPRFPATPEDQRALLDAPPLDVLRIIFELRAREFYDDVRVLEDPAALRIFRERVHRPLVVNSCATAGCHADPGAGRLRLVRDDMFSDETVYTNFLILDRFRLEDDTPLVNYDQPAESPLLQMALPRDASSNAHPVVPADTGRGDRWRPTLRSADDRRFLDTLRWINAMYRPRPEYPIRLQLPPETEQARNDGPPR